MEGQGKCESWWGDPIGDPARMVTVHGNWPGAFFRPMTARLCLHPLLVEALVKDDDWLDAGMRVDFSGTVLSHLIRRKSYLIAINIVMPSLQGLLHSNGNSKSDILSPARVFSSVQHFRLELVWHCYCQDRVGGL